MCKLESKLIFTNNYQNWSYLISIIDYELVSNLKIATNLK